MLVAFRVTGSPLPFRQSNKIFHCGIRFYKHITLLKSETFLRNKHEIAFFEIKCTFFGRKENTISVRTRLILILFFVFIVELWRVEIDNNILRVVKYENMLSTLQTLNMIRERFYDIKISMNAYECQKLWVWFLNTHCWSQEKIGFCIQLQSTKLFFPFLNVIKVPLVVLLLFIDQL